MRKVHLIGAGPGAADLLTLRAAALLRRADIVFYDALVSEEILALAERAEKVPVGKRCGRHSTAQAFINKRLVDAARKHAIVVRLKGGDPMLFGRAQEEIDALAAAGIAVEVVPGVTAALASSAALGISLTRRGTSRSVVFATPRVGPGEGASDWIAAVLCADTAVIYMGAGEAQALADTLVERGLAPDTPVAVVQDASLPGESCHVGRLRDLAGLAAEAGGPSTIVIGEVLRERALAAARAALSGEEPARALGS
jgi:uroporphyrin-III C-methyltransferase